MEYYLFKNSDTRIKGLIPLNNDDNTTSVYKIEDPSRKIDINYDENECKYLKIGRMSRMYANLKIMAYNTHDRSKENLGVLKDFLYHDGIGFLLVIDNGKKTKNNN